MFKDIDEVINRLYSVKYIAGREMGTVVFLAAATKKPVLVEGPAGVGKTQLAKALSACLNRKLVRLQCYEGLDESKALYEWEYAKQLLYTQMIKGKIHDVIQGAEDLSAAIERIAQQEDAFFSDRFIQARPLLTAITSPEPVVLLIDEVDKADPEFEAFLLELLSDFTVTIPEIGTKKAVTIPMVILTSNNYRDMSDALKRRCIHLYIDYPDPETEMEIIKTKLPDIKDILLKQLISAVTQIRRLDLKKKPCISESIDWAEGLMAMETESLDIRAASDTLSLVCKYKSDHTKVLRSLDKIIE